MIEFTNTSDESYTSMDFQISYLSLALSLFFFVFTIHFFATKRRICISKRRRTFPPSPSPSLPIFGHLFSLGNDSTHKALAKLAKIHGPIMLLNFGQLTTAVFSSAAVAKEALQKHDLALSNRFVIDAVRALNHEDNSLVFLSPTPKWRNLRRIVISHVLSVRKLDNSQNVRESKVKELRSYIRKCANSGTVIDIGQAGFSVVMNLLSTIYFSMDLGDPTSEFSREFTTMFRGLIEELGKQNVADYFPIMKNIDLQGIRRRIRAHYENIVDMFDGIVQERLRDRCSLNYVRRNDLLDALLDMKAEDAEYIEPSSIPQLILDLIVAGTDTTSNSFEWAMAELLHNPEKLEKLQAELQEVVRKGNTVEESHISQLPYLQAIVKETLRLHPPAPNLVPRKPDSDVNICGYTIPANTTVLFNVWAIARDLEIWEDPEMFKPERFLGSTVDFKGHDFELIPFGAGRRLCPGMPLAIRIIPLMVASLIHEFNWVLEVGVTPENMNMDEKSGFTVEKAQRLRAIPNIR